MGKYQQDVEDFNNISVTDPCQIVKILSEKVSQKEDFFWCQIDVHHSQGRLHCGKGRPKRSLPTSVLRVHYSGVAGIDTGAMSQEFLAEVISTMGKEMFTYGSPADSTYHIQHGNFCICGEIVAVSFTRGGPPPCFLEQCAYEAINDKKCRHDKH